MKKKIMLYPALLILLLAAAMGTVSCKKGGSDKSGIKIYYLNKDGSSLEDRAYTPKADETEEIIDELLGRLTGPPEDPALQAPISGFSLESSAYKDGALSLDFSSAYHDLPVVSEILTRTAIVHTLCSYSEVTSVGFTVEGEPLTDAEGEEPGQMTPAQFIYNADTEMRNYEKVRLHLYFANESGDRLVDTYRNVVYNSNMSLERLVVEQVLKGTESSFAYPTLNPETKVISVTTRDRICYVNLDSNFQSEPYHVTPETAIYSLVNSLTELDGVENVQISVDGQADAVFMESLSLSASFSRNESLILGGGTFGRDE
ncbi:MAG: GerMN domain-containing protein [Lachnospiraceae bacterium]|nr:GerMN domain-containing protein [Lachnospiraceae bacterium]